jgi:hypothetical protein
MNYQVDNSHTGVRIRTFKGGGDVVLWVDCAW